MDDVQIHCFCLRCEERFSVLLLIKLWQQELSLFLDLDLSVRKYQHLRTVVNSAHNDTIPSFYRLKLFKKHLYADISCASETAVEVNIEDIPCKIVNSISYLINISKLDSS